MTNPQNRPPRAPLAIVPEVVDLASTDYLPVIPYDTSPRELEWPPRLPLDMVRRAVTAAFAPEAARAEALMRDDFYAGCVAANAESIAQRLEEAMLLGGIDSWNRCAAAIEASNPRIQDLADTALSASIGRSRQSAAQTVNAYRMRSAGRHAR